MTWKEFKDDVEKQGVTDDMKLDIIDVAGWSILRVTINTEDLDDEYEPYFKVL